MVAVIQSNETPRRRALVVDDSRIARHVLSGMLDRRGFEVETVDSAEAALNRVSGRLPNVIFMDHLLPGMQGLEAVRRLRARADATALRIVMFTSQDGDLFAAVARAAGADDIFVKTSAHVLSNHQSNVRFAAKLRFLLGIASLVTEPPRGREKQRRADQLETLLHPVEQTVDQVVVAVALGPPPQR